MIKNIFNTGSVEHGISRKETNRFVQGPNKTKKYLYTYKEGQFRGEVS